MLRINRICRKENYSYNSGDIDFNGFSWFFEPNWPITMSMTTRIICYV